MIKDDAEAEGLSSPSDGAAEQGLPTVGRRSRGTQSWILAQPQRTGSQQSSPVQSGLASHAAIIPTLTSHKSLPCVLI